MRRNPINLILTGIAVADLLMMLEYIPFAAHMYLLKYQGSRWVIFAHVLPGHILDHICICNCYICACTSSNARAVVDQPCFPAIFSLGCTPSRSQEEEYSRAWGLFMLFHSNFSIHIHTVSIWYTLQVFGIYVVLSSQMYSSQLASNFFPQNCS